LAEGFDEDGRDGSDASAAEEGGEEEVNAYLGDDIAPEEDDEGEDLFGDDMLEYAFFFF